MKNRALRHGLMAAALAASIAALPAAAHAAGGSDLADWQTNYGSGGYSMPGWMSSLLKMFG